MYSKFILKMLIDRKEKLENHLTTHILLKYKCMQVFVYSPYSQMVIRY